MQTAIVLYSSTGHTKSFVNHLTSAMINEPSIFELEAKGPFKPSDLRTPLKHLPDLSKSQTVVIASPVHGGRLPAPIMTFLEDTRDFSEKQVILMATHFFPFDWGCKQMFEQMQSIIESKGGKVSAYGEVCWTSLRRKKLMADEINKITRDLPD